MEPRFNIRPARPDEAGLVLEFIKRLADYEKCADEVVADEATIRHSLFVEHSAEVVFAEEDGVAIGFALFFHNFSTFVGRKGLYLEDLFIIPEKRGRGYGKALLKYLARTAVEWSATAAAWNGFASTGTSRHWTYTAPSAPYPWTSGPSRDCQRQH